jgi:hypothetical protein
LKICFRKPIDYEKIFARILEREREKEMNTDFTIDELANLHLALITRQRVIREQWIPNTSDSNDVTRLTVEADALEKLGRKVCAAQLSKEMGFEIQPVEA